MLLIMLALHSRAIVLPFFKSGTFCLQRFQQAELLEILRGTIRKQIQLAKQESEMLKVEFLAYFRKESTISRICWRGALCGKRAFWTILVVQRAEDPTGCIPRLVQRHEPTAIF